MPVLHVTLKDGERRIPFAPGLSVREILDTTNIVMPSAGGVFGACGLCLIHIEAGAGSKPTANELINRSPDRIHREIPLACQLRPLQDIRITIAAPARTTNWRSIDGDEYSSTAVLPPAVPAVKQAGEALQEISTTEFFNLREIRHLVIVGNTSMLALLSGRNFNFISDLMAGVLATQAKEPI